jgi:exo-beta-1,3-glucanase (GH17 family)/cellulose synthase/poly-beta-1,6-N-acetylglucosamine synthase-like glycosyltransferase
MTTRTSVRIGIVGLVVLAHLGAWIALNRAQPAPDWTGTIRGVSFSPYQRGQDPLAEVYPSPEEIDRDLTMLGRHVERVRTYSSLDGIEEVPRLAAARGLTVTAGAWLDQRLGRNEQEIVNLIRNARTHSNIDRLIVGNEAVLRGDLTVDQLVKYIRVVRKATGRPVSTAEPWHVWLKHPELVREVDFIAVHILPYWEGVPADTALEYVLHRYDELRSTFPGKPILVAEVGWPSDGHAKWAPDADRPAEASRVAQAQFVRGWLSAARERGIDYFIMEAFDQPWKRAIEGPAGKYWGLWDVDRAPKFAMTGPVVENPHWALHAALAVALGLLPGLWFVLRQPRLRSAGHAFMVTLLQGTGALLTWNVLMPLRDDFGPAGLTLWAMLVAAQLVLLAVVMVNAFELVELLWNGHWLRRFRPAEPLSTQRFPKVSLHLAICNEPPELVIETLDSLAALDYPDFEVLVIDNNTPDPAVWRPVEAHCRTLGPRFRFFSLGKWPGFKAGALNFALRETAPDAEVIGVVDSDYVVDRDWLKSLVPHFNRPEVGFVQAPQDHRAWEGDHFQEMINWEYAGFFHLGMVHRNERNAIIQHGTMTLIRRPALEVLGGWAEWTICEDAELGLRLLEAGYESVYVNHVFGRGLTPHSFSAFKKQRFRWAYGGFQILKGHWRQLFGRKDSALDGAQRYHFVMGWLPWMAEGLHLVFTGVALVWTFALLIWPDRFDFPPMSLLLPVLAVLAFKLVQSLVLYAARVPCSTRQRLGAAVAGMSLTHVIGRAMLQTLVSSRLPFLRTPKAESKPGVGLGLAMAREESMAMAALWLGAAAVLSRFGTQSVEVMLWAAVMVAQSLPYLAALYTSLANALPSRAPRVVPVPAPVAAPAEAQPLGLPQEVAQRA